MAAARFAVSSSNGAAAVAAQALSPKHSCLAAAKPSVQTAERIRHIDQPVSLFSAAAVVARSASLALASSGSSRPRTVTAAVAPTHAAAGSSDTLSAAAATTATLLEWMQQQGCVVCGVELEYSQGPAGQVYRELKASKVCLCGWVHMQGGGGWCARQRSQHGPTALTLLAPLLHPCLMPVLPTGPAPR